MKIGFVIPTKDRPDELLRTISSFESLDRSVLGDCPCIVVVDNASHDPVELACTTRNGIAIQQIRLERNAGASARNIGVSALDADWVVMLDDDSQLQQCDLAHVLDAIPSDVAAVGGEIFLPDGSREAGGLPEVVIGCGCVVRRDLFLEVGGYDAAFDYYVEEYDLCARLIQQGYKVIHTHSLRFLHRKVQTGRAFDRILHRLVRNNAWVIQRYAPHSCRDSAMKQMLRRYELIATKENVSSAFQLACDEIEETTNFNRFKASR